MVAGSAPYTYQWQFTPAGGNCHHPVASNTQDSNNHYLHDSRMSSANAGSYTVTVNNAADVPVDKRSPAQLTLAPARGSTWH